MTADDIAETLGMARSNVSNSIKDYCPGTDPGVPDPRRPPRSFRAETDIWEVAARIAAGRKEREIDPAVDALRACVSTPPTIRPSARSQASA